ncbi:MAG: PadR family transcriptional regulator [Candidatus Thorarchaeota archaeon]|nr:PadR family transcriptional regulator [Candidatus Thorarchaeota archaeon]
MRTIELKTVILKIAGKDEFYGYEIHKKLQQRKIEVGIGRLYSVLSEMKDDGFLKDRWEKSQSGPKRRIYRISKKGEMKRDEILGEAIKTVHEFYTEYLNNLPPELSVFNFVSKMLAENLPKNANMAYAATRFSEPVKKIMSSLANELPMGQLYAIHERENRVDLGISAVTPVDGTFEDIPMKDKYLDLLMVSGNIKKDCLDSCLREWQRVISKSGILAILSPTALLTIYRDPLGIEEFIEQREHPRPESEDSLDISFLRGEIEKYFERVEVNEIVHITVIRGFNPLS